MKTHHASGERRVDALILILIILGAALLTFPGFLAPTSTSAPWVIDNALNHLRDATLTSEVFWYPMLQANTLAAFVVGYLGLGLLSGAWDWPGVWVQMVDPFRFMALGEAVSLLFGIGAIVATYFLGRRMLDRRAGLWAAAILAFAPTFNRYCHEAVPDAAMTFFSALACLFLVALVQNPSRRNYILAGAFLGLAAAAKYNAGLLAVVGICIHLWLWRKDRAPFVKLIDSKAVLATLAGVVAFALTSFQVLLLPGPYLRTVLVYERNKKMLVYSGLVDPDTFIPWISHLKAFFQLEYGIALLFLLGLLYAFRRRNASTIFMVLAALLAFAYIGRWKMVHPRFYLFVYPALAALAGQAVVLIGDRIAGWWAGRKSGADRPALARLPVAGICAALILWSIIAPASWRLLIPDTRELAKEWIEKNVAPGTVIAGPRTPEHYPALLSREKVEEYLQEAALPENIRPEVAQGLNELPSYRLIHWYFNDYAAEFPAEWPEEVRARYQVSIDSVRTLRKNASLDHLREEGAQYIVTSAPWMGFYLRHSGPDELPPYDPRSVHFANIRDFYLQLEQLPDGEERSGIRRVAAFLAEPGERRGPDIKIYRIESDSQKGETLGQVEVLR